MGKDLDEVRVDRMISDSFVSCLSRLDREDSVYCATCATTEDFVIQLSSRATKCPYCGSSRLVTFAEYSRIREEQERAVLAQLPGGGELLKKLSSEKS